MTPEERELAKLLLDEKNKTIPKRNELRRKAKEAEAAQPIET
jgi:hypothetical protein